MKIVNLECYLCYFPIIKTWVYMNQASAIGIPFFVLHCKDSDCPQWLIEKWSNWISCQDQTMYNFHSTILSNISMWQRQPLIYVTALPFVLAGWCPLLFQNHLILWHIYSLPCLFLLPSTTFQLCLLDMWKTTKLCPDDKEYYSNAWDWWHRQ